MKKIIPILLVSLLASCSSPTSEVVPTTTVEEDPIIQTTPKTNWTYSEPEVVAIRVTKTGVEVVSIDVINIPTKGIPVAKWDEANICLRVTYSDLSTEDFQLMEKHIPLECRHFLGEIGHHTLSLAVNGTDVKFSFDIIKNPDFQGYNCKFIDTRIIGEEVLQEITVGYYQTAVYSGKTIENWHIDQDTEQVFSSWDYSTVAVHQDMEFRTRFVNLEKRYYGRRVGSYQDPQGFYVMSTYTKNNVQNALVYLGRSQCVAFYHGKAKYHERGVDTQDLKMEPLNPFNEMWNETNSSILEHGVKYIHDSNYNQIFYSSPANFVISPVFLSNFESSYPDIHSRSIYLEDGDNVEISVAAAYDSCYEKASMWDTSTHTVEKDEETGYYRLATTMDFDIFVSVGFSKLTDGRYKLEQGAKYLFAPYRPRAKLITQYSTTETFGNTLNKQLVFSNVDLYHVAESLEW